uniref:Uncharacterized protein n=1 Tax=Tanacetum cinerariifolium TaxID=118510 RepID=A0A699UAS3_TANCI|nr:hypothetical protein [Tanacetum cinerariifolium]
MEGNKSIQRSDEQKNLYKALVEAYESDKIILDTYKETVTLKRRRDDDADKDEEPSARPDRGKRSFRNCYQKRWQVNTRVQILTGVGKRVYFCRGAYADYLSDGRALTSIV